MSPKTLKRGGYLLLILSVVFILLGAFLPIIFSTASAPGLSKLLQPLLCEADEELLMESQAQSNRPGQSRTSAHYICVRGTERRNAGERFTTVGIALVTMIQFVAFGMLIASERQRRVPQNKDETKKKKIDPVSETPPNAPGDLTPSDRLEDLKRAYDMNLISEAEYQRKRQAILDDI